MLKFLQTVWLLISIFGAALTIFSFFAPNFTSYDRIWFGVITSVALGMFFVRRKQRMSLEKKTTPPPAGVDSSQN